MFGRRGSWGNNLGDIGLKAGREPSGMVSTMSREPGGKTGNLSKNGPSQASAGTWQGVSRLGQTIVIRDGQVEAQP